MAKLNFGMSLDESIKVMCKSEGGYNPGALRVLCEMASLGDRGIIAIAHLDDWEIYGSDIWIAYKDVCKENMEKLIEMAWDHKSGLKDRVDETL